MDGTQNPPDRERWCLGRRSIGTRPLTDLEIAGLHRQAYRHLLHALWPFPLYIAVWSLIVVASLRLPATLELAHNALASFVMVWLLLGLPVTILITRDAVVARRDAIRDARAGWAECFDYPPREGSAVPTEDHLAHTTSEQVVLIGESQRVLEGPREMIGKVGDVARIDFGYDQAWRVSVRIAGEEPYERRSLTEAERAELRRAMASLGRVNVGSIIAVAWLGIVIVAFLQRSSGPAPFHDVVASIASILICLIALWQNAQRIRTATQMRRDLSECVVIGVRDIDGPGTSAEFLPHSRLLLWVNGAPAEWRDRLGR